MMDTPPQHVAWNTYIKLPPKADDVGFLLIVVEYGLFLSSVRQDIKLLLLEKAVAGLAGRLNSI